MPRPLGYRVLLELPKKEIKEKSEGGIYLPPSQKKEQERKNAGIDIGTIVDMSPGAFKDPNENYELEILPKIGDRVMFDRYAGKHLEYTDGRQYRLVKDAVIYCVLTEDDKDLTM